MSTNAFVIVKNNDVTSALRLLKKKLKDEKVMVYFQAHLEYEKPSAKKRRKKLNAIKRTEIENELNKPNNQ